MILRNVIIFAIAMGMLCPLATVGCSGAKGDSVLPNNEPLIQPSEKEAQAGRVLWGMWQFTFNESTGELTPIPLREAYAHFDITPMLLPPNCSDCVEIFIWHLDPVTHILDVDVTLKNPTAITGYDVRGILYTDDYGHELLYPDDWTGLWDIAGGQVINPFKAFAKQMPNRAFGPSQEYMEKYLIHMPTPPHYSGMRFAVDASWPGNCKEPCEITNFWQEGIYDTVGSKGKIYVDVTDWQEDVNKVTLSAPQITGEQFTQLAPFSGITWTTEVTNQLGVDAGDYSARIIATSANSGSMALYDFVTITIGKSGVPENPVDVTPLWLGSYPARGVCIDGDYLYASCHEVGLVIFDISDPAFPAWVNTADTPVDAQDAAVSGGYAYVADASYSLVIIDIDPPESAYIYQHVETPGWSHHVALSGGYAYVADAYGGLQIIDIDPPESASIVKAVPTTDNAYAVAVLGGYAYVADDWDGLDVIDVEPPESAYIVKSVSLAGEALGVDVSGGYAYIAAYQYGFHVVDVDPPEAAYFVKAVTMPPNSPLGVAVSGNYAYAADGNSGLQIVDISAPESAYFFSGLYTPGTSKDVAVSANYAYLAAETGGVKVIRLW